jgi:mannose-6-phosphate isomerase
VHAIGAGVVLAEIQQMSDATFRIYDWGRVGADGRPRKLHLAEALESTDFDAGPVNPLKPEPEPFAAGMRERLSRCPYFALERLRLTAPASVGSDDRFTILMNLGGSAEVRSRSLAYPFAFGQTYLLPSSLGACELAPRGGETCVLTCVVP